jgi:phage terminase large subunit-like protein
MTMTTTRSRDGLLPVPREQLLEIGLTGAQVDEALEAAPLHTAFQADRQPGAYFDAGLVRRKLRALGAFRHTKGRWAGKPMTIEGGGLSPWQVAWIIAPVFGWVFWDEEIGRTVRVIRTAWIEVPRKAGKSTLSSGIGNVLLLADDEPGAEVYAAAGSLPQAGRVFDDAKRMCLTSKHARKRVDPLAEVIRVPATGAVFRALSKIAETAHGLNVSGAIVDEVHVHKRRDLIDAIETGTGARDQPLIVFITTADEAAEGTIYDEKHGYAEKCANGTVTDVSHYGVIWAAEETDDPFAESTWRKANPGLGTSPTLRYLRKEAEKARTTPSYFPTFLRLHLNVRRRETSRLIDLGQWDRTAGMADWDDARGRPAWGGLDLSAVSDFTAWCVLSESADGDAELDAHWRFWIPEERAGELERQLQVPLSEWVRQGFVTLTEGSVIDYGAVEKAVIADSWHTDMRRIGYDRMFAGQLVQNVDKALRGVDVVPVAQTFLGQSPSVKEVLRLLGREDLRHGGNPVARWMASVTESRKDENDNLRLVKPDRGRSQARIDGMAAMVIGMDGWVRRAKKRRTGAYAA